MQMKNENEKDAGRSRQGFEEVDRGVYGRTRTKLGS
jgi:hypothetical protein